MKRNLLDLTGEELKTELTGLGFSSFNSKQIFDWIYKKHQFDLNEWSNISKKLKAYLIENFELVIPKVIWQGESKDGTRKFLLKLEDGQTIESVLIPARERLTQCISSQVGCAIGCTFCHTGTQGLKRNLKAGEITGQYLVLTKWLHENVDPSERITNIVYMGQGEPLHNYNNVKAATINFLDDLAFGLGQRRITLSTSGLVPKIKMLGDFPPVNIAISLHAADNSTRTQLMPINKAYDLERLFEAIKTIPLKAHRRITYEYLLIEDLNDQPEDIDALCNLINRKESKINLIPFNEYPGCDYKRPSPDKILWFMQELNKRGYTCTVRQTKGDDILAACGQLKTQYEKLNLWDQEKEPRQADQTL
ncbi:MAG: 23S rRNA (adenine(2503)-C(2))-methyltransferase RlmN [Halobacteriovoraceae bacterium]|nr:23S rRNA (adenine(2503)-C(2))-methyltransferase RlmN [Halobacteriovoraceae bacterium]|tara:strand:- start:5456 stop:6547 length:1092 start_codon:yes stop_codon:yes gene_type:complete